MFKNRQKLGSVLMIINNNSKKECISDLNDICLKVFKRRVKNLKDLSEEEARKILGIIKHLLDRGSIRENVEPAKELRKMFSREELP